MSFMDVPRASIEAVHVDAAAVYDGLDGWTEQIAHKEYKEYKAKRTTLTGP